MSDQIKIKSNQFRPTLLSVCSITILLAVVFLIQACSDSSNPVADFSEPSAEVNNQGADEVLFLGNITDPVVVNGYEVAFNGKTYNEENDQSTFSYTVSGENVTSASNSFTLEVPACAGAPVAYSPSQSAKENPGSITWEASLSSSGSRTYTVSYAGNLPVGFTDATIKSGNTSDTQEVPGPCKGIYTVSGYVYVDANSNHQKDGTESGIGNVTVELSNGQNATYAQKTAGNGYYEFTVFTGSNSVDFYVEVPENTADNTDFNELLFDSYSSTLATLITVTVDGADETGNNFGFAPQTAKMIQQFEDGTIELNTENPQFWIKQLRWARNNNKNADVSRDELLAYLTEIEGLLLDEPFKFEGDKIEDALDILTKPTKTEFESLLVQLLAAELNIVSGRGSNSLDFDLALAALGEAVAAELMAGGISNNLYMSKSVTEVSTLISTSNSTTSDTEMLLTSFNFSGGGGGGIGTK